MKRAPHVIVLTASCLLAMIPPAAAAPTAAEALPIATGELSGTLLTVSPGILFDRATLRIAGPGGYEAIAWSEGQPFTVDLLAAGFISASDGMPGGRPLALPEGRYGFEVVFRLADGEPRRHHGTFVVGAGPASDTGQEPAPPHEADPPRDVQASTPPNPLSTKLLNVNDTIQIWDNQEDGRTAISLHSATTAGWGGMWWLENHDGDFRLANITSSHHNDRFTFTADERLGIGTTVPQADLHIYRPGGNIRITDSDACPNANAAWEIEEDFGKLKFEVVPNCPGDLAGGKLWLHGTGDVGIGTSNPADSLHINRPFPAIRLTDSDPCPISAASWQINQAFGKLRFAVVPKCAGDPTGTKMSITGSGRLGIGTDGPLATLHVVGDGIIEGDVALGSSRTFKHEVLPLDGREVLDAVRELPLYEWKYKDDPHQASHVGPMAEDVHAAFRLGRDEKHLSPADSAGLALAAIQGLDRELRALRAENRELRERLAELEKRLDPVPLPPAR